MLVSILAFLVAINVMVFVHELGHLWAAKWSDMPVSEFAVGFGPKLFSFTRGETEYGLRAIPLGGFVNIDAPGGLDQRASLGRRMLTISAGVFMNLVLAFLLYAGLGMTVGVDAPIDARIGGVKSAQVQGEAAGWEELAGQGRVVRLAGEEVADFQDLLLTTLNAPAGEQVVRFADGHETHVHVPASKKARKALLSAFVPEFRAAIESVDEGSPAEKAGLEVGDVITAVDGTSPATWSMLVRTVRGHPGEPVTVTVRRDGEHHTLSVTPAARRGEGDESAAVGQIGVSPKQPVLHLGPLAAARYAGGEMWTAGTMVIRSLESVIGGKLDVREMGGPVAVAAISDRVRQAGWDRFVMFMAFVSVNLAVVNFLPLPALDGGYFLMLLIEGVRRKPVADRTLEVWNRTGLALLSGLMALMVVNDLLRLFG